MLSTWKHNIRNTNSLLIWSSSLKNFLKKWNLPLHLCPHITSWKNSRCAWQFTVIFSFFLNWMEYNFQPLILHKLTGKTITCNNLINYGSVILLRLQGESRTNTANLYSRNKTIPAIMFKSTVLQGSHWPFFSISATKILLKSFFDRAYYMYIKDYIWLTHVISLCI